MKKFFLHDGTAQAGPYTIEELKSKQIASDTMVWYEGLAEWKKAGEIPELQTILTVTPPPFTSKRLSTAENVKTTKGSSAWKVITNIILLILILAGAVFVISLITNRNSSEPFKIVIHPPKPRVVESHANEDPSSTITGFHEGVYATILNEGGGGKVMVKATLKQGADTYVKTDFQYIGENQTRQFHFDFTEPSRFGDHMTYDVIATAME